MITCTFIHRLSHQWFKRLVIIFISSINTSFALEFVNNTDEEATAIVTYWVSPRFIEFPLPVSPRESIDLGDQTTDGTPFAVSVLVEAHDFQSSEMLTPDLQGEIRFSFIPEGLTNIKQYVVRYRDESGDLIRAIPHISPYLESERNVRFVATGDPQYQINNDNQLEIKRADMVMEEMIRRISAENTMRGIVISGDLTHNSNNYEWDHYLETIKGYETRIYDGIGNHDQKTNVIYIDKDRCEGIDTEATAMWEAIAADPFHFEYPRAANPTRIRQDLVNRKRSTRAASKQGLHYSWDWHDVHFVQLNLYPGDGRSDNWHDQNPLDPENSLSFLEEDLKANVGESCRPVVLIHHYGVGYGSTAMGSVCGAIVDVWWSAKNRMDYWDVIKDYNVAALITGHVHSQVGNESFWSNKDNEFDEDGKMMGKDPIPTFTAGGATAGYYVEFSMNDSEMVVTRWKVKDDMSGFAQVPNQTKRVPLSPAAPSEVKVTTTDDQDDCPAGKEVSLREALMEIGENRGTITFDPSLDGALIALDSHLGELNVEALRVTIDASSLPNGIEIKAAANSRHFSIGSDLNRLMELKGLSLVGDGTSGGITSKGGLIMSHCTMSQCGVGGSGGAINHQSRSGLILEDCTFIDNKAAGALGGAVSVLGVEGVTGGLVAKRCAFIRNSSIWGGGICMTDAGSGETELINCTFSLNSAFSGGGLAGVGGFNFHLRNCSFVGNRASSSGGGIALISPFSSSMLHIENTIVAENHAPMGPDINGKVVSAAGINLIGDASGADDVREIDVARRPPQFLPLGHYGGETQVVPPAANSVAIDGGLKTDTTPKTDQHQRSRIVDGDGDGEKIVDIGAFEIPSTNFHTPLVIRANNTVITGDGVATISVSIDDPESRGTFDIEIDWGDGSMETIHDASANFSETHQYVAGRNYQVVLNVTGGGGNQGTAELTVIGTWFRLGGGINGEGEGDRAGRAVALSADGQRMVVGIPNESGSDTDSGSVRIYQWDGNSWIQLGEDIPGDSPGDELGRFVAMSGNGLRVALAAPFHDGNGLSSGRVTIYEWSGNSWLPLGLDIDGEAAGDLFGSAVSLSEDGSRLAVGALRNDGNGEDAGHIRVFEWNADAWAPIGAEIEGETAGDLFGRSAALSANGMRLAIGASQSGGNGEDAEYVRVFEWNGNAWEQLGADLEGESPGDASGWRVALSADGSRLAIGAPGYRSNKDRPGQVRVYQWNGSSWVQLGGDINGESPGDQAGWSVSLSADGILLAIGAPGHDGNGDRSGQVRILQWNGSSWTSTGVNFGGDFRASVSRSGESVSLSADGSRIAIGEPFYDLFRNSDDNSGQVRVFDLSPSKLVFNATDSSSGSLRDILEKAHSGQTIHFDPVLGGGVIPLESQLVLRKDLVIDGSNLAPGITLDAQSQGHRIMETVGMPSVTLKGLNLINGEALGSNPNNLGGAIYNPDGALTIEACTLTDNQAQLGGAIYNSGNLVIERSTLAENMVTIVGGGIYSDGPLEISHATIVDNVAVFGGGIFSVSALERVSRSIIANNQGSDGPDVLHTGAPFIIQEPNLFSNLDGSQLTPGPNILVVADPMLSDLGDYGGPTWTRPPLPGSPAIDGGGMSLHTVDQRGFPRPIGNEADLGAVEWGGPNTFSAWALEALGNGGASFTGDEDGDTDSNGYEFAIGAHGGQSDADSDRKPALQPNGRGGVEFTFGYRPGATGLCWIVERSNTVGGYTEIYRYDGESETPTGNVEAQVDPNDPTKIIVTDRAPMDPRTFYRLRIVQKGS